MTFGTTAQSLADFATLKRRMVRVVASMHNAQVGSVTIKRASVERYLMDSIVNMMTNA